jgi:hypothetical protein
VNISPLTGITFRLKRIKPIIPPIRELGIIKRCRKGILARKKAPSHIQAPITANARIGSKGSGVIIFFLLN